MKIVILCGCQNIAFPGHRDDVKHIAEFWEFPSFVGLYDRF